MKSYSAKTVTRKRAGVKLKESFAFFSLLFLRADDTLVHDKKTKGFIFMTAVYTWFAHTLGKYISAKAVVFIVSMFPILECRGGLVVASMLKVPIIQAIPLCVIGNLLPLPFILLLIKKIFKWLKRFGWSRKIVEKLEARAAKKGEGMKNGEFIGLLLFVGVPLPGTGGWTGSLVASFLEMDFKRAIIAVTLGVLLATVIMAIVSYGLLANFVY